MQIGAARKAGSLIGSISEAVIGRSSHCWGSTVSRSVFDTTSMVISAERDCSTMLGLVRPNSASACSKSPSVLRSTTAGRSHWASARS
jgi:hypothetical protein